MAGTGNGTGGYKGFLLVGELLDVREVELTYKTGEKAGQKFSKALVDVLEGSRVHTVAFFNREQADRAVAGVELRGIVQLPVRLEVYKDKLQVQGNLPRA